MKAMRWIGLALGTITFAGASAGCGAGGYPAEMASPATVAPTPPMGGANAEPSFQGNAPPAPPSAAPPEPGAAKSSMRDRAAPADRPGLGTQWGENRDSRISRVSFVRDNSTSPFSTAAVYYNDEEGARAMSNTAGFRRAASGSFSVAGGLVSIGLRSNHGNFLPGFVAGGRSYVVGEAGQRYSIVVQNHTDFRLEVVVSADGLDVMDGAEASFSKRGYVLDPRGEIDIDGFRQSMDTVAAFRFGSVRGSYAAQKHGDTRNVGVIGVAVFNERGTRPIPWDAEELRRRRDANPFPGQFATPP